MPMTALTLRPGVNVEQTATLNEAGYTDATMVRWRDGLVQKIGGWVKYFSFSVGGTIKALHGWQDFNATSRLAVGSTTSLGVVVSTAYTELTPQTKTTDTAPAISTTAGSATVTVADTNISNVTTFDTIYFNTPIAVGGIILSGGYLITLVLSATSFTIQAAVPAVSAVVAGGAVPSFTTVNGSASVSVTMAAHGLVSGSTINFPISTAVGGCMIVGTYTVSTITSPSVFTVTAATQATAAVTVNMNSGNVETVYYIALGPSPASAGYGTGTYGSGGYGQGVVPTAQTGTRITATDWTLANWGSVLLACSENGGLYAWDPNGGFINMQLIANAPIFNAGMFIAQPAQILVAYGSTSQQSIGVNQDPLLVKWSGQLDYTVWTPSTTNQAGSYRLPSGSRIVGGIQSSQSAFLWTDLDVYAMQYVGFPLVFGFNKVGSNCGLIGKHAVTQYGGQIFWMGASNFYTMTGSGATPIPCTVWDAVFQDLDPVNQSKCVAWTNSLFDEVWFFYPSLSGGTGECDKYVKITLSGGGAIWDKGVIGRTAAIDKSVLGQPLAAGSNGIIYAHETGYDADGSPLTSSFTTGYFDLAAGQDIAFLDWVIPDMIWGPYKQGQDAVLNLTFYSQMYPGDTPRAYGPFSVTRARKFVAPRIRGRQVALKVESSDLGSSWRLGKIRYRLAVDGRQ